MPSQPTPNRDGEVPIDSADENLAPGETITITFPSGSFLPFENVYATWYSTPVFGGWYQADAEGGLAMAIQVPSQLAAGSHTLQVTGATSNLVYASEVTLTATNTDPGNDLAFTGAEPAPLLAVAAIAILAGGVLLLVGARRRQRQ